jgi:hypothetical protein
MRIDWSDRQNWNHMKEIFISMPEVSSSKATLLDARRQPRWGLPSLNQPGLDALLVQSAIPQKLEQVEPQAPPFTQELAVVYAWAA